MNWMTIAWPMVMACCLTMGLINLLIAMGDGRRAPHIYFFFSALSVAAVSGLELALLRAEDLGQYQTLLRWSSVPILTMVLSVIGFVSSFFGTGRRWLAVCGIILMTMAEIANLVSPGPAVRYAVAIHSMETFGGVR